MNLRVFSAYITGLGAIGWSLVICFLFLTTKRRIDGGELLVSILAIVPCLSSLYLIFSKKLYSLSASETIEEQNKILRLQIEQQKLKEELNK